LSGRSAAWLARLPWEQEVGRSNRLAPTRFSYELGERLNGRTPAGSRRVASRRIRSDCCHAAERVRRPDRPFKSTRPDHNLPNDFRRLFELFGSVHFRSTPHFLLISYYFRSHTSRLTVQSVLSETSRWSGHICLSRSVTNDLSSPGLPSLMRRA
jgi:hypothetical protein